MLKKSIFLLLFVGAFMGFAHSSKASTPLNGCKINYFYPTYSTVNFGVSAELNWDISNCVSAYISPLLWYGSGFNLTSSGANWGNGSTWPIYSDTIYTLYVFDGVNYFSKNITIDVQMSQISCRINSFLSNPLSVVYPGGTSLLSWSTTGCTSASIEGIGTVPVSGSRSVTVGATTDYLFPNNTAHSRNHFFLTASNSSGSSTKNTTVNVVPCSALHYVSVNPSVDGVPSGAGRVTPTVTTWSSWSATSNVPWITIDNPLGMITFTASYTANLSSSPRTGTVTVNAGCATDTYTITQAGMVTEDENPGDLDPVDLSGACQIDYFTTSTPQVFYGDSASLNWKTTDCKNVSIDKTVSPIVMPNVAGGGSSDPLWRDTIFTLTADGASPKVVIVEVRLFPSSCSLNSFSGNNVNAPGQVAVLSWNVAPGCKNISIDNDVGALSANTGSVSVVINQKTTYFLSAYDEDGNVFRLPLEININSSGGTILKPRYKPF